MGTGDKMLGGNQRWTSIPSRGVAILLVAQLNATETGISSGSCGQVGSSRLYSEQCFQKTYVYITLIPFYRNQCQTCFNRSDCFSTKFSVASVYLRQTFIDFYYEFLQLQCYLIFLAFMYIFTNHYAHANISESFLPFYVLVKALLLVRKDTTFDAPFYTQSLLNFRWLLSTFIKLLYTFIMNFYSCNVT